MIRTFEAVRRRIRGHGSRGLKAVTTARPSLARNVVSNWANTAATILYTLIITPTVVRTLGAERYGLWSFLNGFLAYSDLLYLGLGTALIRYVAERTAKNDESGLARLVSVVWTIYAALGVLSLLLCIELSRWLPDLGQFGSFAKDPSVALTCVLLGVRLMTLFVASVYSGVLVGINRTDVALTVRLGYTLLRCVTIPLLLHFGDPLVTLAAIVAVSSVFETVTLRVVVAVFKPGLRTRWVIPSRPELRMLYGFGLKSFFVLLAIKIISYTDTTVIGIFLGPAAVALYVLPLQIVEYGRIVINGISTVLLPELSAVLVRGSHRSLREPYIQSSRIACVLAVFVNVSIIFLGAPFLTRWVGPEYGRAAEPILIYLGCASIAQALSTQVSVPFYQATDRLAVPVLVLLTEGAANLGLSIWFVRPLGIAGVALATMLPSVLISGVILPLYMSRLLRVHLGKWIAQAVLPGLGLVVALLATYSALEMVPWTAAAYVTLAIKGLLGAAVAGLMLKRVVSARALWGSTPSDTIAAAAS